MTTDTTVEIRLTRSAAFTGVRDSKFYLSCVLLLCGVSVCLSLMIAGPTTLTLGIAAVPLVLPALLAYFIAKERGMLDPAALFAAAFAAYNGIILARFTSLEVQQTLIYPVGFERKDFFYAGLASTAAALSIALVWFCWPQTNKRLRSPDTRNWFGVGMAFYVIGVGLYFLEYWEIGGYWASISMDRIERIVMLNDHVSFPYLSFVIVGIVLMSMSGLHDKRRRKWIFMMASVWCLLLLPQGDRKQILETILSIGYVAMILSGMRKAFRWRYIGLALAGYLVFVVFGQLRVAIPLMISSGVSMEKALNSADTDAFFESVKPEKTEFAGPYLSVLLNVSSKKDRWMGRSYLESLVAVVPRALYPGTKAVSPANQLAQDVHLGPGLASGWGYSPVAEALLNFGYAGAFFVPALWMALFLLLSNLSGYAWGAVAAAVLVCQSVTVNRMDFRTIYLEIFYNLLCLALAAIIVSGLKSMRFSGRSRSI